MQINVSPAVNSVVEQAVAISVRQGHFYVGVEHLFAALLDDSDVLPEDIRDLYLNAWFSALRECQRQPWSGAIPNASGEIFYTPRAINAINQATKLAERFRLGHARPGHLMLSILSDPLAAPSSAMDALELDRPQCIKLLTEHFSSPQQVKTDTISQLDQLKAIRRAESGFEGQPATPPTGPGGDPAQQEKADGLNGLVRSLSREARKGRLSKCIGRDSEQMEMLQILTRKTKNNVMLVGEAGVGKTQLVEGLARHLARHSKDSALPDFEIFELNIAALMAGTQYRGAFEEKVLKLLDKLKQNPQSVLFIDEIHMIMGAGATDGDVMSMANLLKPVLARGEIRCVGATTVQEYRKFVEKDPAIERRFQMVRVEELSPEDTLEVLKSMRPSLEKHHGVRIRSRTLQAAITLTGRYMPNRNFPDKAIDVLDQACSRHRLRRVAFQSDPELTQAHGIVQGEDAVNPHDIRKVVSQITAVPIEQMTSEERLQLNDLDRQLRKELIGQDEAVAKAVAAVKKSRAGLADPNRPDAVILFLGPTGVGKTQLAKLLARHLFGSTKHLITFDMSEYQEEHSVAKLIGAPPGYAGHDEEGRLTGAVKDAPFSILLFDEIEKAHPRVYDLFLPIFDEGRLKDARGRNVDFRNCIIIMTSNIGADLLYRSETGDIHDALVQEMRGHFRPEFINRIDEIVPFYPLLAEDIRNILRLEINSIRHRLRDKHIGIRMYQQAYEFLAEKGYNRQFGARELRRIVDTHITKPISERLLNNEFRVGDMIDVLMEDGQLTYRRGKPHDAKQEIAP
ncbi:MAG: ATP-dependent Clp protease ATP-binding subunit [Candidatus Hydrogenedentes bacterium]|nr:ATP-dependent Clp protease ATP-binding subunit [Candidatus Hydrogenedentota bacterium]